MTSSSKTLVFTGVTLAIVGASQLALAQTAPARQPDATAPAAAAAAQPAESGAVVGTESAAAASLSQDPVPVAPASAAGATAAPAASQEPQPVAAGSASVQPAAATLVDGPQGPVAPTSDAPESSSWFARTPISTSFGKGEKRLVLTFWGTLQTSAIHDSTRSYAESIGSTLVARSDTIEGRSGRTQFSPRGTRLGFSFEAPEYGGVRTLAAVTYGIGPQMTAPPDTTEGRYYSTPTMGLYQAYLKVENPYVDVLAGLTYGLFGWQNYYFPCTAEYFALPNQTFSRNSQVRLSHRFGDEKGPVSVELAVAAARPAQRDSGVPDGTAGLRFAVNGWKGIGTGGVSKTIAMPLSVGVSGVVRQFKVDAFTPPPAQTSNSAKGWGVSIDGFLPVIPANDDYDRGNRLTLTGSFAIGTGIGDLVNATGGATFPRLPNPALAQPAPVYPANIDDGIVTFDSKGILHTIDWRTIVGGFQYYLPPTGRLFITGNITQAYSKNIADLYPKGGFEVGLLTYVARISRYYDVNLFWDATPSVRVGASLQYTNVEYIDGNKPHNLREMLQALYVF